MISFFASFILWGLHNNSFLVFGRGCFDLPWLAALFHHKSELALTVIFSHIWDNQVGVPLQLGVELGIEQLLVMHRLECLEGTESVPDFPNNLIEFDSRLLIRKQERSRLDLSLFDRCEFSLRVLGLGASATPNSLEKLVKEAA